MRGATQGRLFAVEMIAVGVVLGLAALSGYRYYSAPRNTYGPLRVPNAEVEVGDVWQTSELQTQFELVNEGDQSLTVNTSRKPCPGCGWITPESLELQPGESRTVTATFDLFSGVGSVSEPKPFEHSATVVAQTAGEEAFRVPLTVSGTMKPSYEMSARMFDLGTVREGTEASASIQVVALCREPLTDVAIVEQPEGLNAAVELKGSRELYLTVAGKLERDAGPCPGRVSGRVTFKGYTESGPFATGWVPVSGRVVGAVAAVPSAVSFDGVPLGEEWQAHVQFFCRGEGEFAVVDFGTQDERVRIEPIGIPARSFAVRFAADSPETVRTVLDFMVFIPDEGEQEIEIPVWATVLPSEWATGGAPNAQGATGAREGE